eukprot:gnl/MRDRNA2_/MRDRNA2_49871_c0_seq1.p1 gnl/MRDRNA2_/MRDRNA2_49871_c0~~gnl/MRDRNA2_/MRDRNA2_49871_c0_seq1.p1  ORF type:complete len:340 (-),score=38.63 gnl/MRDRNA2_/MRDRNA2_49871_c0_seq1:263-1282(-)
MDQLHNLYFLLHIWIQVYLVDIVLNTHESDTAAACIIPNDRLRTVFICGMLYLLPLVLVHFCDIRRERLGLLGRTSAYLKTNLLQKYLNYNADSCERVSASAISVDIVQNSVSVALSGYENALVLMRIVGKLVILSCFVVYRHWGSSSEMLPFFFMPFVMVFYVCCRMQEFVKTGARVNARHVQVTAVVNEVAANYRMIVDYAQRPHICELFTKSVNDLNAAQMPLSVMQKNNEYFPQWLATVFTSTFIIFSAKTVLDGGMSLGSFLAMIRIYTEFGEEFKAGFKCLMGMISSMDSLRKITEHLNLETELNQKEVVNRWCRRESHMQRQGRHSMSASSL